MKEEARKLILEFSSTAKSIFVNPDGKLYHSGEYGMYREAIIKDFLKFFTPGYYEISQGFIITSNNKISTQCDIILYDRENTLLIQNGDKQRFFSVETVVDLWEVKSILSKNNFKKAINKLAKNKALRSFEKDVTAIRTERNIDEKDTNIPYKLIYSFIICEKLDFNLDNVDVTIKDLHDSDIECKYRHNIILNLNDGVILYDDSGKKIHIPMTNRELINVIDRNNIDKYQHIFAFAHFYYMAMSLATVFYPEFIYYLT